MIVLVSVSAPVLAKDGQPNEVQMPANEYKALDTFEAHVLSKADESFAKGDYRRSAAEYDAFILEFAKSKAIPYALLRKGRSLHLDDKRYEAIKEYNELLDYFPNNIVYAGAALYYIGLASAQNGDEKEATKAWAEMAEDADYSKHVLAADAINRLSDFLKKNDQLTKAINYYIQVATDFRQSNPEAAFQAIWTVVPYFIRTKPDEPKLREFYTKVGGFDRGRKAAPADFNKDLEYWNLIRDQVKKHGEFNEIQKADKVQYYGYWAKQMSGKFVDNDDFQIDVITFGFNADGNVNNWYKQLDTLFAQGQKGDNYDRILRWITIFRGHKPKVEEYYNKLDFAKMAPPQIRRLMQILFDEIGDAQMARNVFSKIPLSKLSDAEKVDLARYLFRKEEGLAIQVCQSMQDQEQGKFEILSFYYKQKNLEKSMPLCEELIKSPKFAQQVMWYKGELLESAKKYKDAIMAYRQIDQQPDNLWKISGCYAKMGEVDQAVSQLREIENFFKDQSSKAALAVANIYRDAGKQQVYVAELRNVLKKYPKSGESSAAHQALEALGVKIGGGVDAE
jgi:TolA-binding protein